MAQVKDTELLTATEADMNETIATFGIDSPEATEALNDYFNLLEEWDSFHS